MHLTNYSVNKHNEFYKKNVSPDAGSKRSIRYFNEHLREKDIDVALLWRNIADMIIKTLLVAEPHVLHAYRMCRPGVPSYTDSVCFEVLGFDVLIDQKQRPWLLEVSFSLTCLVFLPITPLITSCIIVFMAYLAHMFSG